MIRDAEYAQIDNYLDLYLYAGELQDKEWQAQIRVKLTELLEAFRSSAERYEHTLRRQYVEVSRALLTLCQKIRTHMIEPTDAIAAQLFALKQKRLELGKEIDAISSGGQRIG
ncbi:hypothetical protein ABNN70_07810 [Sporolactobacillus sp. Y61]|uniref:Uncharacterized protein n=1 Tax=Sporolactobacillus sp. Y61 TaxID=3160863 RepID=A0AAU8IBQ5_9BACL